MFLSASVKISLVTSVTDSLDNKVAVVVFLPSLSVTNASLKASGTLVDLVEVTETSSLGVLEFLSFGKMKMLCNLPPSSTFGSS